MTTKHAYIELGLAVLKTEAAAVSALTQRLDQKFYAACDLVLQCEGRIVVTGMGLCSVFGNDYEKFYDKLLAGTSGVAPIDRGSSGSRARGRSSKPFAGS